jgi:hypothetical protein
MEDVAAGGPFRRGDAGHRTAQIGTTTLPAAWPAAEYPTAAPISANGYRRSMTGVTLPSSMSPVSVLRCSLFWPQLTVSARATRGETNGAVANVAIMCPTGCSQRPAGPPTRTSVPWAVSTLRQAAAGRLPAMSSTRSWRLSCRVKSAVR